jgi:protocatechuate 3,4-dioxygenase beta subunit
MPSLDGADYGIAGVTVALLDEDGNVIATTTTDADGNYEFPGLPAGNYTVWVNDTGNLLGGLYQTEDPDATVDGRTPVTVNGSDDVTGLDFGYTPVDHAPGLGLIGDTIFLDRDGNGQPDAGEGLQGVTVWLFTADGQTLLATTVTDANGNYAFGGLADGSYLVRVDTTTLPDGGAGLTNVVDPDGATAHESILAISDGNRINLDQDFGYVATNPNSISGTIWNDADADGTLAITETVRYAGVTVVLRDDNGNIVATTTTDANGNYSFIGLPDGTYTVDVTDTANVLNGLWHSYGTPGDAGQSQSDPYTVAVSGGNDYIVDFGYYGVPAALGDYVWLDVNGDGLQDGWEPGLPGVLVTLVIDYPNGDTITVTTVTDANGFYSFDNLLLDESFNGSGGSGQPTYTVLVDTNQPALAGLVPTQIGQGDGSNDSGDPAGVAAAINQGQVDNSYDFGFFGLADAGNLPDSYNTLFENSGPGHVAGSVILGTLWISDTNGLDGVMPTPDDNDGVTRSPNDLWQPGITVSLDVLVTGGTGYLVAWFDWNGDGGFGEGEMINFGELAAGVNPLTLIIPDSYTTGNPLNVRFRLYETEPTDPLPTGFVIGGEVEDYQWLFSPTAVTLAAITASTAASTGLLLSMLLLIIALFGVTAVWQRRSAPAVN